MSLIQKNLSLLLVGLLLLAACSPSSQNSETASTETVTIEENAPATAIESETINGITYYNASTFPESESFKQLKKLNFYGNPDEIDEMDQVTEFFPLGWSADGKLAYANYSILYHGDHWLTYTILNVNTGDTLVHKELDYVLMSEEEEESEAEASNIIMTTEDVSEKDGFRYVWTASETVVMEDLKKAGIDFKPFNNFTLIANYSEASFEIEEKEMDPEGVMYTLNSDKYPSKMIYQDYFPAGVNVSGIITSPVNDNIIVICRLERQAFEMSDEVVALPVSY